SGKRKLIQPLLLYVVYRRILPGRLPADREYGTVLASIQKKEALHLSSGAVSLQNRVPSFQNPVLFRPLTLLYCSRLSGVFFSPGIPGCFSLFSFHSLFSSFFCL